MTASRLPRVIKPTRPSDPSVSTLFRKPVTGWYAEWKARKLTAARPPATAPVGPPDRPADPPRSDAS